ncbi:MAG: hypothetical protein JWO30_685, partial [Fibrobacteres bacterium]|nr:hypothetical protein [Fibrobacterota bacterium]
MDPPKEDEMSITATGLETLEKTVQKT